MPATAQRLGYGRDRDLALGHQHCMLLLFRGQLRTSTTLPPTCPCCGNSSHHAFLNQCPLILGQRTEELEGEAAMGRRRIKSKAGQRLKPNTSPRQVLGYLNEVLGVPTEAIELPDEQRVALTTGPQCRRQLRTSHTRTCDGRA